MFAWPGMVCQKLKLKVKPFETGIMKAGDTYESGGYFWVHPIGAGNTYG